VLTFSFPIAYSLSLRRNQLHQHPLVIPQLHQLLAFLDTHERVYMMYLVPRPLRQPVNAFRQSCLFHAAEISGTRPVPNEICRITE
jgi:hypothetical protein